MYVRVCARVCTYTGFLSAHSVAASPGSSTKQVAMEYLTTRDNNTRKHGSSDSEGDGPSGTKEQIKKQTTVFIRTLVTVLNTMDTLPDDVYGTLLRSISLNHSDCVHCMNA